jgi:hypothetical protein
MKCLFALGKILLGTMAFARRSFGVALCYAEGVEDDFFSDEQMLASPTM